MAIVGKVGIVTGGGSGIGEAASRLLAESGTSVVVADLNDENAAAVAESINSAGGEAVPFKVNVAVAEEAEKCVAFAVEKYGEVSILVNNAGVVRDTLVPTMTRQQWDIVLDVNLGGCFNMAKAVCRPMMQKRYGRIVSTSTIAGRFGGRGQANYAASKAGIDALTRVLAQELSSRKRNITVNGVAPGMVVTPISEQVRNLTADRIKGLIPLERYATPEDIANVICFLTSEEADYINGQVIVVDGGLSLGVKW
ncbi:MAG: 3-oxoacyl-ACP reductase FabG [Planctomycetes bacterium]|nr:3-oxoacyl-ACP reductase FabG [Planctomycetota bacterium]